ncbi:hypothetical protein M434DRAFT_138805 [Hypoxylon sp. CO27-5]|nr:hypothetical protein M434DRAFT_138805 [Hypoxylon sp. CO27-5]
MCPPKKKFSTQQWVNIEPCPDTGVWAGCKETGDVPSISASVHCTPACSSDNELVSAGPDIHVLGSLPASLGGTIHWNVGVTPTVSASETTIFQAGTTMTTAALPSTSPSTSTSTPTSTPTSTSNSTQPKTVTSTTSSNSPSSSPRATTSSFEGSPVITSSPEPDPSTGTTSDSNLSLPAQAGIGVGVGAGAALIGGLLFLVFFLRKRKKGMRNESMTRSDLPNDSNGQNFLSAPPPGNAGDLNGIKHNTFISELPADEPKRASTVNSQSSTSVPTSPTGFLPQTHRLYTAYNPHLHGNYALSPRSENSSLRNSRADIELPVSPVSPAIIVSEHVDTVEQAANESPEKKEEETKEGPKKEEQVKEESKKQEEPTQSPATPNPAPAPAPALTLDTIHELSG